MADQLVIAPGVFLSAAHQWGPGKVHLATWCAPLGKYVPACLASRRVPVTEGNLWPGHYEEKAQPLTCMSCRHKSDRA
jgi:hypothetical protein